MRLIKRIMDTFSGPLSNLVLNPTATTAAAPGTIRSTTTIHDHDNGHGHGPATTTPAANVNTAPSRVSPIIVSIGPLTSTTTAGATTMASTKQSRARRLSREDITQDMVTEWEAIQDDLKTKIIQEDTEEWQRDPELKNLKYIAGLDISYPVDPSPSPAAEDAKAADAATPTGQENSAAYVAIAVYSFPDMKLVYSDIQCLNLYVPYIPGFLAFRESKPLVDAVQNLIAKHPEWTPDVLLVDGNGILHPQQAGLASHVGYHTNLPCIGVSKNIFFFEGIEYRKNMGQNMHKAGDFIYLRDSNASNEGGVPGTEKILGMALKTTQEAKNPVYVSIGHRVSLETARKVVLACCKYRIPEPIRAADHMSRELIRQHEEERCKSTSKNAKNTNTVKEQS